MENEIEILPKDIDNQVIGITAKAIFDAFTESQERRKIYEEFYVERLGEEEVQEISFNVLRKESVEFDEYGISLQFIPNYIQKLSNNKINSITLYSVASCDIVYFARNVFRVFYHQDIDEVLTEHPEGITFFGLLSEDDDGNVVAWENATVVHLRFMQDGTIQKF